MLRRVSFAADNALNYSHSEHMNLVLGAYKVSSIERSIDKQQTAMSSMSVIAVQQPIRQELSCLGLIYGV